MSYPYSEKNGFDHPQSYMYTPYGGQSFLTDYRKSRQEIFAKLCSEKREKLIKLGGNIEKDFTNQDPIDTNLLLKHLVQKLMIEKSNDKLLFAKLQVLIKKFEVTKKLYNHYTQEFKKDDDDYQMLENYLLLALLCGFFAKETAKLKFLNCLLKIVDLLSSLPVEKFSPQEKEWLVLAILWEEGAISSLMTEKGLKNP